MEHQDREASTQLPGHLKRPDCKHRIRGILFRSRSFARPDIVLLLIACVALPSVAQQYSNLLRHDWLSCPIAATTRQRIFLLRNDTSQTDLPLARHHIIPATRLIRFFNTSLSNSNYLNGYHESRELLTVLTNIAGHTYEFYRLHASRTIDNDTMNLLKRFNETLTYEDFQQLESPHSNNNTRRIIHHLFVWLPFNIFEGPNNRSDDPGPEFEHLARSIIGQELFDELKTINDAMINYLMKPTKRVFNKVVSKLLALISKHTWHMTTYDSSQWEKEENGKYHIFIWYSKKENQNRSLKDKREINEGYNLDPYCFGAQKFLSDHGDEIFHLSIVGKAFDRAWNGKGFSKLNYNSWKDWYAALNWDFSYISLKRGIIEHGRDMAQGSKYNLRPRGYKFKDGSFAVGIIGDDVKYGNDNWKTLAGSDWGSGDEYAGQIFFDRNGRPVALVMSSERAGDVGSGWSFIYNNGKWEYESKDTWDTRRFAGSTLSLDSNAPRFFIDNERYIEAVKYSYEL